MTDKFSIMTLKPNAAGEVALTIKTKQRLSIKEVNFGRHTSEAAKTAFAQRFGITLPSSTAMSECNDDSTVFWIGEGRWLITSTSMGGDNRSELDMPLVSQHCAINDVSHHWRAVRIYGQQARALLRKGIPLDLSERSFVIGSSAPTLIGEMNVILHFSRPPAVFDLYIRRSSFSSLMSWLNISAAEFGYQIAEPDAA